MQQEQVAIEVGRRPEQRHVLPAERRQVVAQPRDVDPRAAADGDPVRDTRNVELGTVHDIIFEIDSNYKNEKGEYPSAIRNTSLEGLTCRETAFAFSFLATADTTIEDVWLSNITVEVAREGSRISGVDGLQMDNVRVNGELMPGRGTT